MKLNTKEKNRLRTKYGPWAVITGASSGIGRELAERLAEAGLNLVINARNEEELKRMALALETTYQIKVRYVAADVSEEIGLRTLLNTFVDINIGLLVLSAGYGTSGNFIESSLGIELNLIKLNVSSVLSLSHFFGRYFSKQKRGGIIFMSSIVAFQGVPFSANYSASKAYVQSLAEALYLELKPYQVDVLAASPGPVESGFGERANMKMNISLKPEKIGIPILKALGKRTTVYPGFLTKILTFSLNTAPRWARIRIMKIVMSGFTAHQRASVS